MLPDEIKIPLSKPYIQKEGENSLYIMNETGIHMIQNNKVKSLPKGIGYKMGWMVIQDDGVQFDDIVNKFNYITKKIVKYETGIQKARNDRNQVCILEVGKGEFYLFEDIAYYFSNHHDELKKFCRGLEKVCLFYTYRITEIHGFAVVKKGKLQRAYYCDEDRIFSFGKPLKEEKKLKLQFPNDISEMYENGNNAKITGINEDIIMDLAMELTGRESEFDYKKAILLKVGLLR